MELNKLLIQANLGKIDQNLEILGITHDSRKVKPGFLFVSITGLPRTNSLDGHQFINEAINRGAIAIVGTKDLALAVPYIQVHDSRQSLADLSAAFYGFPGKKLKLVGITGSKGKTTTSVLTHHILQSVANTGLISTIGARFAGNERALSGHFTTPEAPEIQELLSEFVKTGCKQAVIEVSSHALALERVRGFEFAVGIFTSFEPEHLDFHQTVEKYFVEKQKLLLRSQFGILKHDKYYPQGDLPHQSFSIDQDFGQSDWQALSIEQKSDGIDFVVRSPLGVFSAFLPMIGDFNVENALAAMAAAVHLNNMDIPTLQKALASFKGVPGRMQIIQSKPFRVINDFAHTENSLKNALNTLRSTTTGRLILVIGAAGERDPGRRESLGRIAGQLADLTIFTEEDYRSESLEAILQTMSEAAARENGNFSVESNRRQAICQAISLAKPNDTVLLAGKGHEKTLERASEVIDWDETEEALAAIKLI